MRVRVRVRACICVCVRVWYRDLHAMHIDMTIYNTTIKYHIIILSSMNIKKSAGGEQRMFYITYVCR